MFRFDSEADKKAAATFGMNEQIMQEVLDVFTDGKPHCISELPSNLHIVAAGWLTASNRLMQVSGGGEQTYTLQLTNQN